MRRTPAGVASKTRQFAHCRVPVANALRWASIALIGIFFASVISVILPIQLFKPEWQDKLVSSIRGGASFPLEGVLFMMLASVLSPDDQGITRSFWPSLRRSFIPISG